MKYIYMFLLLLQSLLYSQFYDDVELNINNIEVHLNNYGGLNTHKDNNIYKAWSFEGETILYSGGFYLSGKNGETLWGNGVFASDRLSDYLPGNIDADPNDEKNKIYIVEITDAEFGKSWQDWKTAVEFGALFYDGDNDEIYNPVDINGNGKWDETEDKPDIIGDYTAWCVYNDAVQREDRLFPNTGKMGIEIKQTVFAYNNKHDENLSNTIFIRYIIENKGSISEMFDSVYFGITTDPDIGYAYTEDYGGSDTTLNSVYSYKRNADNGGYSENPPSIFSSILQGPHAYIPGKTFIDNSGDGEYSDGIDTPLDSAVVNRGKDIGVMYIAGATNIDMVSAISVLKSHPTYGGPSDEIELRNYLIGGRDKFGTLIDIENFNIGNGSSLSSDEIDIIPNQYWFTGNPTTNEGWQCIQKWDYRLINSTGPFKLRVNDPVEVLSAIIIGRGDSPLNSITVTKGITKNIITVYECNFTNIPVSIKTSSSDIITNFSLTQNYPNPFNPTTMISYTLPIESKVKIEIFNTLGQSIGVLVNDNKSAGHYETTWNAENLPSGIYLISIRANGLSSKKNFVQVKKALLLK